MARKRTRQTFEKLKREQAVRERRARKEERRAAARIAKSAGPSPGESAGGDAEVEPGRMDAGDGETGSGPARD